MDAQQLAAVDKYRNEIVACLEANLPVACIDFAEYGAGPIQMCILSDHSIQVVRARETPFAQTIELIRLLKQHDDGFRALQAALMYYGRALLAAALEEQNDDINVTATTSAKLPKLWNAPLRQHRFVGRESFLQQLDELQDSSVVKNTSGATKIIAACVGLGGVGKSSIALEFVYRNLEKYQYVFWVPATTFNKIEICFAEFCDKLHLPVSSKRQMWSIRMRIWLQANPGWLIAFDDAPNYRIIQPFIPPTGGNILVTSRYSIWPCNTIHITPFVESETETYLELALPFHVAATEVSTFARVLGNLPLDIAQATDYMRIHKISVQEYITKFHAAERLNVAELLASKSPPPDPAFASIGTLTVTTPGGDGLRLLRQIGSGAFGFVLEVVDRNRCRSALKMVPVILDQRKRASDTSEQLHTLKRVDHLFTSEFQHNSDVEKRNVQNCALSEISTETQFSTESEQLDYEDKQARREAWFHQLNAANQCPNIVHSIGQWCCADMTKSDYCALRKEMREKLTIESLDAASSRILHDAPEHSKITVYMLQMQFYPMGSLQRWLKDNHGNFSDTHDVRVYILRGILVGLDYIHSQGVIHRDLCPPNVLLEECNGKVIAKIGDFGTAISCGATCDWKLTKTRDVHTRDLGTDPYCAPEVKTARYDYRCDLFSFGMIVVKTMWNVQKPEELVQMQIDLLSDSEDFEGYSKSLPNAENWIDLVKSLVIQRYKMRPNCKTLLENKLFSGYYRCNASASCT